MLERFYARQDTTKAQSVVLPLYLKMKVVGNPIRVKHNTTNRTRMGCGVVPIALIMKISYVLILNTAHSLTNKSSATFILRRKSATNIANN